MPLFLAAYACNTIHPGQYNEFGSTNTAFVFIYFYSLPAAVLLYLTLACQRCEQRLHACWKGQVKITVGMGFAVRVRSAGQKYGPTCHQRDRADVTEFVTLVRLSSLGQHVGVLALAGYKRRKSALTAGPITTSCYVSVVARTFFNLLGGRQCI